MSSDAFAFKQFVVNHNHCAQKVGTDGVLLGAWCHVPKRARVLDIGTGSGLISLMVAQRFPDALIEAVELDASAASQAADNFKSSLWGERLTLHCNDIVRFAQSSNGCYDAIVSNPPFFEMSLKNPNYLKAQARHTDSLSFQDLFGCVAKLLAPDGFFSLIVPTDRHDQIRSISESYNLYIRRLVHVRPTLDSPAKRSLYEFSPIFGEQPLIEELVIELSRHQYTEAYRALTCEFYLRGVAL